MPPAKRGTKPPKSTVAASKQSAPFPGVRPVDASKASKRSRKNKPLKVVGITLGVILGLLVAVYAGIAVYFTDRFMPNSNVGDIDVSLMSAADAEKALVEAIDDYTPLDRRRRLFAYALLVRCCAIDRRGVGHS